jgi:hypothetical protein
MGRDFRASLSSFGTGLDSGFGSGFSAFAFTMGVLLFLLRLPGAGPRQAWKIVEQALKKAHWRLLNSQKMGSNAPLRLPV